MKKTKDSPTKDKKQQPKKAAVVEEEVVYDFNDFSVLIKLLTLANQDVANCLKALTVLKTYARHTRLNEVLQSELIDILINLVQDKKTNQDIIIYSLSLLSEFLHFKPIHDKICGNEDFIVFIYTLLKTAKNVNVDVECLKCLALLCSEESVCKRLHESCDINLLLTKLGETDPDLQASILKILSYLLKDIVRAERIINSPAFNYTYFLNFLNSSYPIIQHRSLNIIIWLTSYKCNPLKEMFFEDNGVKVIFSILQMHKWADLHEKLFKILTNVSVLDSAFDQIDGSNFNMLISYIDTIESEKLQFIAYTSLIEIITKSQLALSMFIKNGLIDFIQNHLKEDDRSSQIFKVTINCLSIICRDESVVTKLEEENPDLILQLFDIVEGNEKHLDWTTKYNAIKTIHLLMKNSQAFYNKLLQNKKWVIILDILTTYGKTPYYVIVELAKIFREILMDVFYEIDCPSESICQKLIYVIKTLMICPDSRETEIKCIASEMLEELVKYPQFRERMREKKMYRSLSKLLFKANQNTDVFRSYIKAFITLSEWDSDFIEEIIYINAFEWIIEQKELIHRLPILRRFIDMIFDKCKYIKIHYTNRLDLWDRINCGFYLQRGASNPSNDSFNHINMLWRETSSKLRPIYSIDFENTRDNLRMTMASAITSFGTDDDVVLQNGSAPVDDTCTTNIWEKLNDPELARSVGYVKTMFGYQLRRYVALNLNDIMENRDNYIINIKKLAEFVCHSLGSINEISDDCMNHSFELHVSEVKENLGSPVVPLGQLKLGTKFEKALLFKTLGDQVNIPSAFVRGFLGNGWIEIYLPPVPEVQSVIWSNNDESIPQSTTNFKRKDSRKKSLKSVAQASKKTVLSKNNSFLSTSSIIKENQDDTYKNWNQSAYQKYMKTNYILDLDTNPGELYGKYTSEAEQYMSEIPCQHPYFAHHTLIPPLVKASTMKL